MPSRQIFLTFYLWHIAFARFCTDFPFFPIFRGAIDYFMSTDERLLVHLMSGQMAWKFMASERINLIKIENILYITLEQIKIM